MDPTAPAVAGRVAVSLLFEFDGDPFSNSRLPSQTHKDFIGAFFVTVSVIPSDYTARLLGDTPSFQCTSLSEEDVDGAPIVTLPSSLM